MMLRARAGKLSSRDRVLRGARLALLVCSLGFLSIGHAGDYSDQAALQSVIDAAQKEGVDADWSRNLIGEAQRQQSILDAIARPAEKTKPWYEYRQIFLTERRVREGVTFWDAHAATFQTVSDRTGVPPEIMVAIIGVETYYGRITGSYRVIDALATLAFEYPRRAPFFTRELEQFLILAWESGKDPLALKGSYAGAMGYGQFMPSSYRAYARSYEGGAAPDIWDNPADAISSVGNYLAAHGWRRDDAVVVDAVSNNADPTLFEAGLKPSQLAGDLPAKGLEPVDAVDPAITVTPLRLEEETQLRYWLGLQNFYVITRYNHSAMYAMAVWELSQAIATARATP